MAEFVLQSVAQIKSELEPIQFLNLEEKRKILKKRERLEYRIRKRKRNEKDFLLYIEYEKDVMQFFKMRKKMRGMKSRAEVPVIKRIHQLYQLCETRFPQSTDMWLQHIDFCKKQKEYSRVGRLFTQMLRMHNTEPELWVKAAVWEVEQNNVDSARTLMQRCVSINKASVFAWVEFYKLELELAKLMRGKSEEVDESDPSVNGSLAQLVAKHACDQCPESCELLLSLIKASRKFNFTGAQRKEMVAQLRERFSDVPRVWDFLARQRLSGKKKKVLRLTDRQEDSFFRAYEEGVTEIPNSEMWSLYLRAGLEVVLAPTSDSDRFHKRMEHVLELFQRAADNNCLAVDMFPQWTTLLSQRNSPQKISEVCELMVRRFPRRAEAWTHFLQHHFQSLSGPQEVVACLHKAVDALPERESWKVWEPALLYLSSTNCPDFESLIEKPCLSMTKELGQPARLFYLRWTAVNKSVKATRNMFNRWYVYKPVSVDFYLEYVKQELMQDKVDMKRIRKAFEDALTDHGKTHPDLWLKYMDVESTYGDAMRSSGLGNRAVQNLPKGPLQDYFCLRRSGLPAPAQ